MRLHLLVELLDGILRQVLVDGVQQQRPSEFLVDDQDVRLHLSLAVLLDVDRANKHARILAATPYMSRG